ncbi:hypothetical protein CSUI_007692 [Cystoisospora suis]|uniref:Uncharacterized protein n=1 Tax=Cystoisospora suis TaxID=483139 RepID=A0A2C6JTE0_9APIC|nr:hypothetical protein CSUI_007692 [Cystoisospora suis]
MDGVYCDVFLQVGRTAHTSLLRQVEDETRKEVEEGSAADISQARRIQWVSFFPHACMQFIRVVPACARSAFERSFSLIQ